MSHTSSALAFWLLLIVFVGCSVDIKNEVRSEKVPGKVVFQWLSSYYEEIQNCPYFDGCASEIYVIRMINNTDSNYVFSTVRQKDPHYLFYLILDGDTLGFTYNDSYLVHPGDSVELEMLFGGGVPLVDTSWARQRFTETTMFYEGIYTVEDSVYLSDLCPDTCHLLRGVYEVKKSPNYTYALRFPDGSQQE